MRIAFTVHKFPTESLGGTEVYTQTLARTLVKAGHEVAIFFPSPSVTTVDSSLVLDGVRLWRVPLPSTRASEDPIRQYWHTFRDQAIERAFVDFWQAYQPELVHFQHVQGVSARLIALSAGVPRVATLNDYWYFCANSQLIRPDRQPCAGPAFACTNCVDCATVRADLQGLRRLRPLVALPFAYRNAYLWKMAAQIDLFLAPSEFLRQQYIQQGFPAAKIVTLEYGMDRQRLTDAPDINLPAPPARPHFGFIGSLAWQKGVHVLIEAFNQLPASAALTIYGSETVFPDYVAELRQLAQHPNIRFAGPINFDHVGAALRQFDALIVPSIWYENSPLVIQEAYVAGVPVIAGDIGALTEKVHHQQSGLLYTAGDSQSLAATLQSVIDQPDLLPRLRQGITPSPTMEAHVVQMIKLYQGLAIKST